MPTISREYHAHSGNYTPGGNSRRYIVVHNTGNTAGARAEAAYAQNNEHPSSYHYVLDGGGTIYQILDDSDTAWAVGAWRGAVQYIGNNESISIEVCSNGVPFTSAEITELHWLVRVLMQRYGIDAAHVVRHFDAHSGHKDCPAAYVDPAKWATLRALITSEIEPEETEMAFDALIQPDGKSYMVWVHGDSIHDLSHPDEVTAIKQVYKIATGKDIPTGKVGTSGAPWFKRFAAACKRSSSYLK